MQPPRASIPLSAHTHSPPALSRPISPTPLSPTPCPSPPWLLAQGKIVALDNSSLALLPWGTILPLHRMGWTRERLLWLGALKVPLALATHCFLFPPFLAANADREGV